MALAEAPVGLPKSSVSWTRVPLDYVDDCWGRVAGFLERGVGESRGRYDIRALYDELMGGHQHLWVVFKDGDTVVAAFTTMFTSYPGRTNLSVVFCGSDDSMGGVSGMWSNVMLDIIEWAKINGCSAVEVAGRRGWARVFRDLGFKESYVMIEAEVSRDG